MFIMKKKVILNAKYVHYSNYSEINAYSAIHRYIKNILKSKNFKLIHIIMNNGSYSGSLFF